MMYFTTNQIRGNARMENSIKRKRSQSLNNFGNNSTISELIQFSTSLLPVDFKPCFKTSLEETAGQMVRQMSLLYFYGRLSPIKNSFIFKGELKLIIIDGFIDLSHTSIRLPLHYGPKGGKYPSYFNPIFEYINVPTLRVWDYLVRDKTPQY